MPKRLEADRCCTTFWAARLKKRTGLSERKLEERLLELRRPANGCYERSGSFTKYALGKRTASLEIQRAEGASAVLLADRIAPGSYWDFCLPLFELVAEIELWHEPELARARFARRIRAEARAAQFARKNAENDERFVNCYVMPSTGKQESYSRLQRIRRSMLAIDGLATERFFRSGLPLVTGFYRTLRPMQEEELSFSFPPNVREFSLALALFLESIEMADIDRYSWSLDLLLASRPGLEADECMKPLATGIWRIIDRAAPEPEDLRNLAADSPASRPKAQLPFHELMSVSAFKLSKDESDRFGAWTRTGAGMFLL